MNNTDLRQRLDVLRWSQRQLADVLGVSEGYVSHLLRCEGRQLASKPPPKWVWPEGRSDPMANRAWPAPSVEQPRSLRVGVNRPVGCLTR